MADTLLLQPFDDTTMQRMLFNGAQANLGQEELQWLADHCPESAWGVLDDLLGVMQREIDRLLRARSLPGPDAAALLLSFVRQVEIARGRLLVGADAAYELQRRREAGQAQAAPEKQ